MSYFLYTLPTDRLTGSVISAWGVEDPAYPAVNLDNNQPSRPAKLQTVYGAWRRDFTTPTRVDFCAIINHNLNTTESFVGHEWPVYLCGSDQPDLAVAQKVYVRLMVAGSANPWIHADGEPQNMFADLTKVVPLASDRTWRWWHLVVNFTNTAPVAVGEWCLYGTPTNSSLLGVKNFGIRNISKGSQRTFHRPSITHTTDRMTRLNYDLGVSVRELAVQMEATDQVRADVEEWFRCARGTVRPFVIVPNYLQDDAWFVNFSETDFSWTRDNNNYNPLSLGFQEVSRGLKL